MVGMVGVPGVVGWEAYTQGGIPTREAGRHIPGYVPTQGGWEAYTTLYTLGRLGGIYTTLYTP